MFKFLFDRSRQVNEYAIFYRPVGSDFVLRMEVKAASMYEANRAFDMQHPGLQRVSTVSI